MHGTMAVCRVHKGVIRNALADLECRTGEQVSVVKCGGIKTVASMIRSNRRSTNPRHESCHGPLTFSIAFLISEAERTGRRVRVGRTPAFGESFWMRAVLHSMLIQAFADRRMSALHRVQAYQLVD